MICIDSIAKLEKLSGVKITDLHRENVDDITIPSPSNRGQLRRTEEVFDCWFESGSMPYAQVHYPFENKELFQKSFPADFIAEGIDQVYISTACTYHETTPHSSLVMNGI